MSCLYEFKFIPRVRSQFKVCLVKLLFQLTHFLGQQLHHLWLLFMHFKIQRLGEFFYHNLSVLICLLPYLIYQIIIHLFHNVFQLNFKLLKFLFLNVIFKYFINVTVITFGFRWFFITCFRNLWPSFWKLLLLTYLLLTKLNLLLIML